MCSASIVKKYIFTFALLAFRTTVTVIDTLAASLWVAASRSLLDCASCCLVNSTRKRRMKLAYAPKQLMDENLYSRSTAMLSSAHKTLKRIYGLKIVDIKNLKKKLVKSLWTSQECDPPGCRTLHCVRFGESAEIGQSCRV